MGPQWDHLPSEILGIRYDVRGFGKSRLGKQTKPTMDDFADDLVALMDELNIKRAAWCGLSMGGYIILRAIEKYPDRARALVLCNTRSGADDEAGKTKRRQAIQLIQNEGVEAFAKGMVPNLVSRKTKEEKPKIVDGLMKTILSQSPESICAAQEAMLGRSDTTGSLCQIAVPTLVIHGEGDLVIPLGKAVEMHEKIPRSRLAVIPEAGHMSNWEQPDEFNSELFGFLRNL